MEGDAYDDDGGHMYVQSTMCDDYIYRFIEKEKHAHHHHYQDEEIDQKIKNSGFYYMLKVLNRISYPSSYILEKTILD